MSHKNGKIKHCNFCGKENYFSNKRMTQKNFYCDARCMGEHRKITRKGYKHSEETKLKMSLAQKEEKSYLWRGDNVGYAGVHKWVKKKKIKPALCERCQTKKADDLANISQEYKRDTNDFEWLCRSCHIHKDGRINNLKQYAKI